MKTAPCALLAVCQLLLHSTIDAFTLPTRSSIASANHQRFNQRSSAFHQCNNKYANSQRQRHQSRVQMMHDHDYQNNACFDPLDFSSTDEYEWSAAIPRHSNQRSNEIHNNRNAENDNLSRGLTSAASTALITSALTLPSSPANAISFPSIPKAFAFAPGQLSTGDFNPETFRPVCPSSDSLYRFLQSTTQSLVGAENFVEYGPLIAGGLLRIRLELCVVESFFNEAVGPFVEKEGLAWVLPLHETVETFLAGSIFALATTFILVGSTKIVSVIVTYGDVFIGFPCRVLGGFAFDRARGKPVTLDIGFGPFKTRIVGPKNDDEDGKKRKKSYDDYDEEGIEILLKELDTIPSKDLPFVIAFGAVKAFGLTSKVTREVLEGLDLFVGRYLTLIATGYIGFKFLHFKVFPDFPPF